MKDNDLVLSLIESIEDPIIDTIEIFLDSSLDDGLVKDIPILKYAIATYNFMNNIYDRHRLRKLLRFVKNIREKTIREKDLEKYKNKYLSDLKMHKEQLEIIIIMLDRIIEEQKIDIIGYLYWAYLNEIINWDYFVSYSIITERLLPVDYQFLTDNRYIYSYEQNIIPDEIMRLIGLGLMLETTSNTLFQPDGNGSFSVTWNSMQKTTKLERTFKISDFGIKYLKIVNPKL